MNRVSPKELHSGAGSTTAITPQGGESAIVEEAVPRATVIRLRGGSESVEIKRRPDHTVNGVTIIVGRSVEVVVTEEG